MPTPKKAGQYTVRTAHPGDVFEASPGVRIDNDGTWAGDKVLSLSEAERDELVKLAQQHAVPVTVVEPEPDQLDSSTDNKE